MASFLLSSQRSTSVLRTAVFRSVAGLRFFSSNQQDLIIIGGGPGGYVAAIKAGQLGLKVTCVEGRGSLGGTCLNIGCIPSKALLHSSHMYSEAVKAFPHHGIVVDNPRIDLPQMMKQKDSAVSGLTKGIEGLFKKYKVDYCKGWGKFKDANTVDVNLLDGGKTTLSAKNIMIATGSDVSNIPNVKIDEERIVSSTGALSLSEVPKSMVVIGGGIIGMEMGSVWSRLGADVTVIEFMDQIVPSMDSEVRKAFERSMKKQGFKFVTGTKVNKAENTGNKVKLEYEPAKGGDKKTMEADIVLVSAGRRPYTDGLNLEAVGVKTDNKGRVLVDEHFRTNVSSIYAIGDVIPGPMLAHKAEDDGIAAAEIIAGKAGHVNYETVPSIMYTWPEVAWVGKTEDDLKKANIEYRAGKFAFVANSRARAVDDTEGMVKFVADKKTDKILGVTIMGPNAGELIPECVLAMEYGGSPEDIARTCHAHPTLSEAIKEAALATYDKPIHS